MSAELELGMRVDALIVKFLEEEGTTIGCSRWIRKNLDLGELKVLAEQAISERCSAPSLPSRSPLSGSRFAGTRPMCGL